MRLQHFFDHLASQVVLVVVATIAIISLGLLAPLSTLAVPTGQTGSTATEPDAGTWTTLVLESGDQFRLPAPPNESATLEEIARLHAMVNERNDAALQQVAYWNSGPPSYRWNQIAMNDLLAHATVPGLRNLALLHAAIFDATIAAWDSKYAYNRPRPNEVDPMLTTVLPNPASPSYPSEYAVTAGAASAVLAWIFPENAQRYEDMAREAVYSRLLAGVEYPSDVEAGLDLGRQVAALVIARGEADGVTAEWTGTVPTEPGHWTGENPVSPMAGTWQTWVLDSPNQFRPEPPPVFDSDELESQMAELRAFERTPTSNALARFWEFGSGGQRIHWFWNDVATRLILEANLDNNAPQAARAYALTNIAGHDAMVACWDAKYTYWAIRPFQLDPEYTPLFNTPNHPGYPSAHSCISSAMAGVLAELFPIDAAELMDLAQQAAESRIWAGIHFRSDVEAGIALGENVAGEVIAQAMNEGAN